MAYSSIVKPTDYFNTVLYTGNGSTQSITGVGFQPDWVWLKLRSTTGNHGLYDAVRGATKRLQSIGEKSVRRKQRFLQKKTPQLTRPTRNQL